MMYIGRFDNMMAKCEAKNRREAIGKFLDYYGLTISESRQLKVDSIEEIDNTVSE